MQKYVRSRIQKLCSRCGHAVDVVFANGEPRFYECPRCTQWGFITDDVLALITPGVRPQVKDGDAGEQTVIGSTGTPYTVKFHVEGGVKVYDSCSCPAYRKFPPPCKHLLKLAAEDVMKV